MFRAFLEGRAGNTPNTHPHAALEAVAAGAVAARGAGDPSPLSGAAEADAEVDAGATDAATAEGKSCPAAAPPVVEAMASELQQMVTHMREAFNTGERC